MLAVKIVVGAGYKILAIWPITYSERALSCDYSWLHDYCAGTNSDMDIDKLFQVTFSGVLFLVLINGRPGT